FGYLVARASQSFMSVDSMKTAHLITWWAHALLVFGFIAWAPYTKMIHALTGPFNIYAARLAPSGAALHAIDFDKLAEGGAPVGMQPLAISTGKALPGPPPCSKWRCCRSFSPATPAGKSLSPRDFFLARKNLARGPKDPASAAPITTAFPATSAERLWQC